MTQDTGAVLSRTSISGASPEDSALDQSAQATKRVMLSVVIPCYNEENTLENCIKRVLAIQDAMLELELIVVDDCSKDKSLEIARQLADRTPGLVLLQHGVNMGKGAALRTG